jgi:hypothetical protein
VRAVNALAGLRGSQSRPLEWSRRDFTDGANNQIFGFYPAYTIQVDRQLFDFNGEDVGLGDATTPVTITTVDSLVNNFGWPTSFTVPQYLFRQGGAYTNRSNNGDHGVEGTVWIKYELDDSNPNGWNVAKVQVFAWDVRDIVHKASANKTRSFSDTGCALPHRHLCRPERPESCQQPAERPQLDFRRHAKQGERHAAECVRVGSQHRQHLRRVPTGDAGLPQREQSCWD